MTLKQDRAAKKRLRNKLDREWSDAVRERDGHVCQRCGRTEHLNAHHIFTKKAHPSVRHDLENGVCLCAGCHLWWAHQEALEVAEFILKRMGKRGLDALRRRANAGTKKTGV